MAGDANTFFGGLGAFTAQTRPPETDAGTEKRPAPDEVDPDGPDVFQLLETYDRWFGRQESTPTETAQTARNTGENKAVTSGKAEADKDMSAADGLPAQPCNKTLAQQLETIEETLAKAEQTLQASPDQPQHSRLEASLSALEAALSGTSLSDLEAALAVKDPARDDAKRA